MKVYPFETKNNNMKVSAKQFPYSKTVGSGFKS